MCATGNLAVPAAMAAAKDSAMSWAETASAVGTEGDDRVSDRFNPGRQPQRPSPPPPAGHFYGF
jgi:hypothetical protein